MRTTLAEAIEALAVADEVDGSYDRDLYGDWVDADANGCDTRDEVLLVENRSPQAGVSDYCEMVDATWFSYYDQVSTEDASDFDVDHLVPLAEAHGSGGYAWAPARREAYANDLGDRRALIAVSATSNRTKSDADPTTWMPGYQACVYVSSWVAIKTRWGLSVDPAEQRALSGYADQCGQRRLSVRIAQVGPSGVRDARESILDRYPYVDPAPASSQPPVQQPPAGATADPRYDTCGDAGAAGYGPYYSGQDVEYDWYTDGDSDGSVCE